MENTIEVVLTKSEAKVPVKATDGSAAYDLYAAEYSIISSGDTEIISTGLIMAIPKNKVGLIFPRSGLSIKKGLRLANCVGVIDSDYRGEVKVAIYNDSPFAHKICCGDRIAQIMIVDAPGYEFKAVNRVDSTDRGTGGFGSTGK